MIIAIQDNLKYSSTFIIVSTLVKQPISDVHLTEELAPVGIMGHNKGPPEARVISEHYRTKGFKGGTQLGPQCNFFPSGDIRFFPSVTF